MSDIIKNPKTLNIKRWNKYIGVKTISAKQHAYLLLNNTREIFYGGSARGGKTISMLIASLQYIDYPEYRALLLRETIPQLIMSGGLLNVALLWWSEYINDGEIYHNKKYNIFTFPSGATIQFSYFDEPNLRSSEFHFIGLDEITDFMEKEYLYLFIRNTRKKGCTIPLRLRGASNPVGKGFAWVKKRFIKSPNTDDKKYIPARLWDNPYVDQEEYVKSLDNLDPVTRAKILDGDWEIQEDTIMFKLRWFKIAEEIPPGIADEIRVWDFAATKKKDDNDPAYTAGVKLARCYDKSFCVTDIIRFMGSPKEVEDTVKNTAVRDGRHVDIHIEQEPGSAGIITIENYARNILSGYTVNPIPPTGSKEVRARPLASCTEKGYITWMKRALTESILDEFLLFPTGKYKDCVDATSHAFNILSQKPMPKNSAQLYGNIYKEEKKFMKS